MLGHCEPPTALSKLTFERKKIPFSIVGFRTPMRCLCRPGRACFFLFCLPLIFLTDSSSSETETGFLSSGFVAALRFVHNCPTRLQQGRFGVLPVLLPYLASKTANRGHTRAFLFPGHTLAHFPLWGKTDLFPILPCPGFPNLLTTGSPLPLKGEGLDISFLDSLLFSTQRNPLLFRRKSRILRSKGFSRQLPLATAAHKRLTRLQQGLSGPSMVSLPCPVR